MGGMYYISMLAHAYKTTSRAALRGCADDAQIAGVLFKDYAICAKHGDIMPHNFEHNSTL